MAAPPRSRLAKRKISFVGTWSPRKGAKDWGEIIRRVRALVPDARFAFFGTLTEDRNVLRDLALPQHDFVDLVAEYQPNELPKLLSDSTVGAFPSYAEGFGFAVLEQLASGIPTVAYDAPGPRSLLRRFVRAARSDRGCGKVCRNARPHHAVRRRHVRAIVSAKRRGSEPLPLVNDCRGDCAIVSRTSRCSWLVTSSDDG